MQIYKILALFGLQEETLVCTDGWRQSATVSHSEGGGESLVQQNFTKYIDLLDDQSNLSVSRRQVLARKNTINGLQRIKVQPSPRLWIPQMCVRCSKRHSSLRLIPVVLAMSIYRAWPWI